MTILHIDSSITGENSVSRVISRSVVDQLEALNKGAEVVRRDLAAAPLPHLTLAGLADSTVVDEFLAADIVVVGAPMYNFGVPSVLKAWIDRISIAGVTFRYTEKGPVGLSGGKRVVIASTRGGLYAEGSPFAAMDFQEAYLRAVFAFLGVTDVEVVRAEGLNLGPEQRQAAMQAALGEPARQAA